MVNLSARCSPRVDEEEEAAPQVPVIPLTGALSLQKVTDPEELDISKEAAPSSPSGDARKLRHVSAPADDLRQKLELLSQLKQASPELRKALLRQLSRLHKDEPEVAAALRETPLTPRGGRHPRPGGE